MRCSSCFEEYDEALGMCPHCGYTEGERPEEPFCLIPGTVIHGRYVIGKMMGVGGFGITYKGWDNTLGTIVAIKEFYPSGLVNRLPGSNDVILVAAKREREFLYNKTRFLDEARNTAKFSTHKNIVNVYDFFEAHNTVYMVMEFLEGETLSHVLKKRNAPLDVDYCLNVASSLCSALKAIHAEHILHRDIAPDNIMICKNGLIKLFDFGAARFSSDVAENSKVTVVVKPGFAPVEQYDKINRQDGRTDMYALGATLYYVMTGTRPTESTNRKVMDDLVPPNAIMPNIPENISNAIMRAMAVEKQFRFANVDEFEKALMSGKPVLTVEKEIKRRRRMRILTVSGAALVLVIAAVVFLLLWNGQKVKGDVTIWYQISATDTEGYKQRALTNIAARFNQEYSDVNITLIGVPEEEFGARLAAARGTDNYPDLFESTGLTIPEMGDALVLTEELGNLDAGRYYYTPSMGLDTAFPTSVVLPAVYVNTTMTNAAGLELENAGDLNEVAEVSTQMGIYGATKADAVEMYILVYGRSVGQVSDDALYRFTSGETFLYFGDTADYQAVQSALPGEYKILFPDTGNQVYHYDMTWSVSGSSGKNSTRAARTIISYMGSELAQDYMHIQTPGTGLPIMRSAFAQVLDIYNELADAADYLG